MAFTSATQVKQSGFTTASDVLTNKYQQEESKGLEGYSVGLAKSIVSLVKGAGQLGEKIVNNTVGKIMPDAKINQYSDEAIQADKAKGGTFGKIFDESNLEAKNKSEKLGKFTGEVAQFILPQTRLAKTEKGLTLAQKIASRALTSGTVASTQSGGDAGDTGVAIGAEIAIPVAGKYVVTPIKNVVSRVVKGLASGLSGVGTNIVDQIVKNPEKAKIATKALQDKGNTAILQENAKTILDGVSRIKQEARKAFSEGLEQLKETDINPATFREQTQAFLDKIGSVGNKGKRLLENVEFTDPVNIKKANTFIDRLSNIKLDGKSLRKLADDIENAVYKTATSDERLSFNAFLKDFSATVKNAVTKSTDKLGEINANFSRDINLASAIEKIFGKVKFKNLSEINSVSQKLETLFSKKGLTPQYIDDFMTRLGLDPTDFKTSEAVRQITDKTANTNTKGLNIGEIIQQVTSGIVTPKMVRDIATSTGFAEQQIKSVLQSANPYVRETFVKALKDLLGGE